MTNRSGGSPLNALSDSGGVVRVDRAAVGAPELGPVGDVNALYEPVQGMRPVPIGLPTLAAVLVPAGIPMLGVLALEIPIKELLGAVAKALM